MIGGELKPYRKYYTAKDLAPWAFREGKYGNEEEDFGATPPCTYGAALTHYLNQEEVRHALHIPDKIHAWEMCGDSSGEFGYRIGEAGSVEFWEKEKGQYKMLAYSGDVAGALATAGTRGWIENLDRTVLEEWRPYYVNSSLAGYVEEFDGLTFGTVHGAGQSAPQSKPAETFHLVFNWIAGQPI